MSLNITIPGPDLAKIEREAQTALDKEIREAINSSYKRLFGYDANRYQEGSLFKYKEVPRSGTAHINQMIQEYFLTPAFQEKMQKYIEHIADTHAKAAADLAVSHIYRKAAFKGLKGKDGKEFQGT